jgi:hypothetical protein
MGMAEWEWIWVMIIFFEFMVAWKLEVQAGTKAVRASEKEKGGGVRERRRVVRRRETANQGKRLNMSKTVTVFKWSLARGVPKAGQRRRDTSGNW